MVLDSAQDSLYSEFSASVQEMLDDLQNPLRRAERTRAQKLARPFLLVWVVLFRLSSLLRQGWRRWIRLHPGLIGRAGETLIWPALFLYLSWVSNPANPFYFDEGFPWPWIGPWLIALRYGTLAGTVATLELLLAWHGLGASAAFPRLYFLGGAIMMLVAGEFGSVWGQRAARLKEATRYLDDKIERLTRRLYLLKLSHDELESELIDRPGTLRDAMFELRALLETTLHSGERLPGAQPLMRFIAQYGQIEVGGLYEYIDGPRPVIRRVAAIGSPTAPEADDPMLRRAVETGQSIHLMDTLVDFTRKSALLVVAPVLDSEGATIGILAINRMPFVALNADNLRTIWTLIQSYAEFLRQRRPARDYQDLWPDAPLGLREEFGWLQRLQLDFGVQSYCVVWRVEHEQQREILQEIRMAHRNGDMAWQWQRGGGTQIIGLLPFMSAGQLSLETARIRALVAHRFDPRGLDSAIFTTEISLGEREAWTRLRRLMERRA